MMKKFIGLVAITGSFVFTSFIRQETERVTVSGVILSDTGKPVAGALVYVTPGEEEALTKEKGEFSIETSKKTPFVLTAEHWEYQKATVTVTDAGKRVTIKLTKRK